MKHAAQSQLNEYPSQQILPHHLNQVRTHRLKNQQWSSTRVLHYDDAGDDSDNYTGSEEHLAEHA